MSVRVAIFFAMFSLLSSMLFSQDIRWEKSFGTKGEDRAESIQSTHDGGYIVAGYSEVDPECFTSHNGKMDAWVAKLDASGNIEWQEFYGGSESDYAYSIVQTRDDGYIFTGYSMSQDGDVSRNYDKSDVWVVKLDHKGRLEWEKNYGGTASDYGWLIKELPKGGYLMAGTSESKDVDLTDNHGRSDIWIIKIDESGEIIWQKNFGGPGYEYLADLEITPEGKFVVLASAGANGGDVKSNKGDDDYWLFQLTASGDLEWERSFGGDRRDNASSMAKTSDGGYILAGSNTSKDIGKFHLWLIKVDKNGTKKWEKFYDDREQEYRPVIYQTPDGFFMASQRDYYDSKKNRDVWLVKLDHGAERVWEARYGGNGDEFVAALDQSAEGHFILAGYRSTNKVKRDAWVAKVEPCFKRFDTIKATATKSYLHPISNSAYYQSGYFTDTFPNVNGCERIVTLDLFITRPEVTFRTVEELRDKLASFQNDSALTIFLRYNDLNPPVASYYDVHHVFTSGRVEVDVFRKNLFGSSEPEVIVQLREEGSYSINIFYRDEGLLRKVPGSIAHHRDQMNTEDNFIFYFENIAGPGLHSIVTKYESLYQRVANELVTIYDIQRDSIHELHSFYTTEHSWSGFMDYTHDVKRTFQFEHNDSYPKELLIETRFRHETDMKYNQEGELFSGKKNTGEGHQKIQFVLRAGYLQIDSISEESIQKTDFITR